MHNCAISCGMVNKHVSVIVSNSKASISSRFTAGKMTQKVGKHRYKYIFTRFIQENSLNKYD